jgi:subtilisin-like proprotein convertase family protein
VLAVNPALRWQEVKDVLKRACDRIDPQGGNYDAAGHSNLYGFGRLNAHTAVLLATPQPQNAAQVQRRFDAPIPDLQTVRFSLAVADSTPIDALRVDVDLKHTFIGDLVITLEAPAATGVGSTVLHERTGGATAGIKKTYDQLTTPALSRFRGKSGKGTWTLVIRDAAARDSGTLAAFGLTLEFVHPTRMATAPRRTRKTPARRSTRRSTKRASARARPPRPHA